MKGNDGHWSGIPHVMPAPACLQGQRYHYTDTPGWWVLVTAIPSPPSIIKSKF